MTDTDRIAKPTDVLMGGDFISREKFDEFNKWLEATSDGPITQFVTRSDHEASKTPVAQGDTDRIAQMAREAGFDVDAGGVFDPTEDTIGSGDIADHLARFARLVAEDCAKVCDDKASKVYDHAKAPYLNMSQAIRASYSKE